jgi:hypothetical protein
MTLPRRRAGSDGEVSFPDFPGKDCHVLGSVQAFLPGGGMVFMCSSLSCSGVTGLGGIHHLVAGGLSLGEGHYLPDIRLVFEEHDQAVHPGRYSAVWRRP